MPVKFHLNKVIGFSILIVGIAFALFFIIMGAFGALFGPFVLIISSLMLLSRVVYEIDLEHQKINYYNIFGSLVRYESFSEGNLDGNIFTFINDKGKKKKKRFNIFVHKADIEKFKNEYQLTLSK